MLVKYSVRRTKNGGIFLIMNEQNNLDQEILDLEKAIAAKLERPGHRCIIDQEIAVLAAKVLADCTPDRKGMVMHLFELVGFNVTNLREIEERGIDENGDPNIGAMIAYAAQECYVSVATLSKECGVSRPLLYKYMHGTHKPSAKNAKAITKALQKWVPDIKTRYRKIY